MSKESQFWSRRNFVKTTAVASVALQMPLWWSCVPDDTDEKKQTTLQAILDIVLPKDEYGPGALEFNADRYILWWLKDDRIDPVEINFVKEHLTQIENENFLDLGPDEQEEKVYQWAKEGHHQNFLSKLLTLTFEALVSHPNYGFKDDFSVLEWIAHVPGIPQPSKELIYPQIFKTIQND